MKELEGKHSAFLSKPTVGALLAIAILCHQLLPNLICRMATSSSAAAERLTRHDFGLSHASRSRHIGGVWGRPSSAAACEFKLLMLARKEDPPLATSSLFCTSVVPSPPLSTMLLIHAWHRQSTCQDGQCKTPPTTRETKHVASKWHIGPAQALVLHCRPGTP